MRDKTVLFRHGEKELQLPLNEGSEGEQAIDISRLRTDSGLITMDSGYGNTGACESAITFLDGEKGILRYRGYPIEALCESASFMEVSYLLYHGELPTRQQLEEYTEGITRHTLLPEKFHAFLSAFPPQAHPMAILSASAAALGGVYSDSDTDEEMEPTAQRLMGKIPTLAGWIYKHMLDQPRVYPDNSLGYVENFLKMMFSVPAESYEIRPEIVRALDILFILHADHEQNCSTSTVRIVGSAHADLYASISAGIAALSGPLHGGANQAVLKMLHALKESGESVQNFIIKVKDKQNSVRLMGFGHRVYKNFDPRERIIKTHVDKVLKLLNLKDPMLDIARELETAALNDSYFIERKLYPNVDFYSGILYRALGIPENMFTVMFSLGRLPGWIAHWREMRLDKTSRICRPRQVYTGATERSFQPLSQRG